MSLIKAILGGKQPESEKQSTDTTEQEIRAGNTERGKEIATTLEAIDFQFSKLHDMDEQEFTKMETTRDYLSNSLNGTNGVIFIRNDFKEIDQKILRFADRWSKAVENGNEQTAIAAMRATKFAIEKCRIDPPADADVSEAMEKRIKYIDRLKQYIDFAECVDYNNNRIAENKKSYNEKNGRHKELAALLKDQIKNVSMITAKQTMGGVLTNDETVLLQDYQELRRLTQDLQKMITLKQTVFMPHLDTATTNMETIWLELENSEGVDSINIVVYVDEIAQAEQVWRTEITEMKEGTRKLIALNESHKAFIDSLRNDPFVNAYYQELLGEMRDTVIGTTDTETKIKEAAKEIEKNIEAERAKYEKRNNNANQNVYNNKDPLYN